MTMSFKGFAAIHETINGLIEERVRQVPVGDFGVILADYSLRILGFMGSDKETPIAIPIGYWMFNEMYSLPYDFMTLTPDGAYGGYVTPADPLTPVLAQREGEHDHVGVGSHSHSDPQGGGTGGSTVDIPGSAGAVSADGGHYHRVITPYQLRPLMPGDFVAISWVDNRVPYVHSRIASSFNLAPLATGGGQSVVPPPPYTGGGGTPLPEPSPTYSPERGIPEPSAGSTPQPPSGPTNLPVISVVGPGETMETIAQRYGVPVGQIVANNPHYSPTGPLPPFVMVVVDMGGS